MGPPARAYQPDRPRPPSEPRHARRSDSGPADAAAVAAAATAATAQGSLDPAGLSALSGSALSAASGARTARRLMEWLWASLLILGASYRPARPFALLLALKWASNYTAFRLIGETAPALIDIALGAVGVIWASRLQQRWADVVIAGFVLTPLLHAWFWLQPQPGALSPSAYYWMVAGLFSVQAAAVAWPAAHRHGRGLLRRWISARTRPSSP